MTDQVKEEQQNNQQQEEQQTQQKTDVNIFEDENTSNDKADDQAASTDQGAQNRGSVEIDNILTERLSTIVDENGEQKYKDPVTALDALKHSQEFIRTLQEENKTYRDQLTQRETMEQALQNLSASKEPDTTKSEGLDADAIKQATFESIKEYEAAQKRKSNLDQVSKTLSEMYGDTEKAKKAYQEKAQEYGMTVDMLREIAATSPKAALEYFKVSTQNKPKTTSSSVNPESLNNKNQDDTADYMSRYMQSSSPSLKAWREVSKSS